MINKNVSELCANLN